jgi:transglutaminase-like putative cysteine protease
MIHRAGTCRDFTVLLCAMLRETGIPARAGAGMPATSPTASSTTIGASNSGTTIAAGT